MEGSGFLGRQDMVGLELSDPGHPIFHSGIKGDLRKGGISGEEEGMLKN